MLSKNTFAAIILAALLLLIFGCAAQPSEKATKEIVIEGDSDKEQPTSDEQPLQEIKAPEPEPKTEAPAKKTRS